MLPHGFQPYLLQAIAVFNSIPVLKTLSLFCNHITLSYTYLEGRRTYLPLATAWTTIQDYQEDTLSMHGTILCQTRWKKSVLTYLAIAVNTPILGHSPCLLFLITIFSWKHPISGRIIFTQLLLGIQQICIYNSITRSVSYLLMDHSVNILHT